MRNSQMQQQKGKEEIENQVLSEYVHDFGKKKSYNNKGSIDEFYTTELRNFCLSKTSLGK